MRPRSASASTSAALGALMRPTGVTAIFERRRSNTMSLGLDARRLDLHTPALQLLTHEGAEFLGRARRGLPSELRQTCTDLRALQDAVDLDVHALDHVARHIRRSH